RVKGAVEELTRRLHTVEPAVQEEMCIALGRFAEKSAITHLTNLLHVKTSFWKKSPKISDAVRVRAVWALGQLLPDAEAEAALQRAQKDPVGMVQRAAVTALNKSAAPS